MNKTRIFAIILAVLTIATCLCGCGDKNKDKEIVLDGTDIVSKDDADVTPRPDSMKPVEGVDLNSITGSYILGVWDENGNVQSAEHINSLAQSGMSCELYLREDGTGSIVLFGEAMDATWDEGYITAEGEKIAYTFKDGVIVMSDGEVDLQFIKISDNVDEGAVLDAQEAKAAKDAITDDANELPEPEGDELTEEELAKARAYRPDEPDTEQAP